MVLRRKLVKLLIAAGGLMFLTGCSLFEPATGRGAPPAHDNHPKPEVETTRVPVDTQKPSLPPEKKDEELRIPLADTTDNNASDGYYYLPETEMISMDDLIMDNVENLSNRQKQNRDILIMNIIKYLGVPYVWGGNTINGLDCSGFTKLVFREAFSIELFRVARDQFTQGEVVPRFEDLQFGDLIFFDTRPSSRPGHVGIYLGHGLFAHASTKQGVIVSSFDTKYYRDKYMGGRRFKTLFEKE